MLSLVFPIMLVVVLVLFVVTRLATEALIRNHYAQREDFFSRYPAKPGDIVFLGDSITDGACWDELFPDVRVKNRGINGDTTHGVLNRMQPILVGKPKAIFLLIGTNDLPWYAYRTDAGILATYEEILQRCRRESPDTRVFVQSIFPRRPNFSRRIKRLNAALEQLAAKYDYTFIDIFPHLADRHGGLRHEFTNDRLHLMGTGYYVWVEQLAPYVRQVGEGK